MKKNENMKEKFKFIVLACICYCVGLSLLFVSLMGKNFGLTGLIQPLLACIGIVSIVGGALILFRYLNRFADDNPSVRTKEHEKKYESIRGRAASDSRKFNTIAIWVLIFLFLITGNYLAVILLAIAKIAESLFYTWRFSLYE